MKCLFCNDQTDNIKKKFTFRKAKHSIEYECMVTACNTCKNYFFSVDQGILGGLSLLDIIGKTPNDRGLEYKKTISTN